MITTFVACPNCQGRLPAQYPVLCSCGSLVREDLHLPPLPKRIRYTCGDCLHKLLAAKGYEPTAECPCNSMIAKMNANGPIWCRQHEDEIVAAMVEEAKRRKIKVLGVEPPERALRWRARKWVRQAVRECERTGG